MCATCKACHDHVGVTIWKDLAQNISWSRRRIRLIEGNTKCRHLKKITFKGTLKHVFICLRNRAPYSLPPLHTLNVYIHIFVHIGKGEGGELNQREGSRGNSSQIWVENTNNPVIQGFSCFQVNMFFLTKYSMFLVRSEEGKICKYLIFSFIKINLSLANPLLPLGVICTIHSCTIYSIYCLFYTSKFL
jgi:hypothetical protein